MFEIPCTLMRAGTSKGLFIQNQYLPMDIKERDKVLLKLLGSPHIRQIDGLGNGDSLSSKVAIVKKSHRNDADIDFLFAQVMIVDNQVSTEVNCGNILSGVAPYAIDTKLIQAKHPTTIVRIYNENTKSIIESIILTPNGEVTYEGDTNIDGVPGTGAPIVINFSNVVGKTLGNELPTGNVIDIIDTVEVSLVDVAVPVLFMRAETLNKTGYETKAELDADKDFLVRINQIRAKMLTKLNRQASPLIPKIALVSEPRHNGHINSRYFTPHSAHAAHAVTGALCLAASCFIPGTLTNRIYNPQQSHETIHIEHASGKIGVEIDISSQRPLLLNRAGFVRTARPLFDGLGMAHVE